MMFRTKIGTTIASILITICMRYDPVPIVLRPDPSGYHSLYDAAVSEYDFMEYYSDEHFLCMKRIDHNSPGPNVPFAMAPVPLPIRGDAVRPLITYQHDHLSDPVFDHHLHVAPGITNHEDMITLQDFAFREHDWMQSIECSDTYNAIDNLLNWPRAPNHGAPVDVHGFPMTHHYDSTDTFVPHGIAPAFYRINRDHPTRNIPSNLVLQQWPTGPDQRIVDSNPLYQFARPNVPIDEDVLRGLPDIHAFNPEFFDVHDLRPNMLSTIFRNPVHDKIDLFRTGAAYHRSPPKINGQFPVLHHNFYPSVELGQVYGIPPTDEDPFNLDLQYQPFPGRTQHPWHRMIDQNIVSNIDDGLLDCSSTEQRSALWNHTLPLILPYPNLLYS
eukprot:scaffold40843_cov60-Attheya_sp.AAC.1